MTLSTREYAIERIEAYADRVKMSPDRIYRMVTGAESTGMWHQLKSGNPTLKTIEVWEDAMEQYPDGPRPLLERKS